MAASTLDPAWTRLLDFSYWTCPMSLCRDCKTSAIVGSVTIRTRIFRRWGSSSSEVACTKDSSIWSAGARRMCWLCRVLHAYIGWMPACCQSNLQTAMIQAKPWQLHCTCCCSIACVQQAGCLSETNACLTWTWFELYDMQPFAGSMHVVAASKPTATCAGGKCHK